MRNADVWVNEKRIRVFCIDKWAEDSDRYVRISYGAYDIPVEDHMQIHGKGTVGTVLAGYPGITTYNDEFYGPRSTVEERLERFQKSAQKAGFTRKGVIRLD